MSKSVEDLFSHLSDPRQPWKVLHKLSDILFIALCTLLSNGLDFEDMEAFARERRDWLLKYISLSNGIPSHDTFNRVFQLLEPDALLEVLKNDGDEFIRNLEGLHINFDGKKIKGYSPKSKGNTGLFVVTAWINEHKLCLGQQKVDTKSNEKTAIPKLLESIDIKGSTITIDAIGTQEDIAKKIIDKEADYILALKKNQKTLFEEVDDELIWSKVVAEDIDTTYDNQHGRIETRVCKKLPAEDLLEEYFSSKWANLKTIIRIEYKRVENNITTCNTRYYISSKEATAHYFNLNIRGHWSIENQLHWHLDMTFEEDKNRCRTGHAQVNLNSMRKIALNKIKRSDEKLSLKKRKFKASLNKDYLEELVFA
jgi:predicted transposase YbfD/YdcC